MSIWTVKPVEVSLDLVYRAPDGTEHKFWVKVKKSLTVGEERRVQTAGWRGVSGLGTGRGGTKSEPSIDVDWKATSFARNEAYLLDWSLEDDDHRKMPVTRESIEALEPDVYNVIEAAITAHVEKVEQEKKVPSGSAQPSTT